MISIETYNSVHVHKYQTLAIHSLCSRGNKLMRQTLNSDATGFTKMYGNGKQR